jgi:anti-sigma regulatory factor (Ser/Thr protein kinase)
VEGGVSKAIGSVARDGATLVHRACFYDSAAELTRAVEPIVRAGLRGGDVVFAAAKPATLEALRDLLGDEAGHVELHDGGEWCARPWERLGAIREMLASLPDGTTLYVLGEPPWGGSDAAVREWARFESIVNLALAGAPVVSVCLYDERELPDEILRHGRRTHPERLAYGTVSRCEDFVPPAELVPALALPVEGIPFDGIRELTLNGNQHAFRAALTRAATELGVPRERLEQVVVAVNEVATNALLHGRPPLRARCWAAGGDFVCEIVDSGPGLTDPLAGWLLPATPSEGGWGLSIARQLCDAVEIAPEGEGTRVTLHVELDGS